MRRLIAGWMLCVAAPSVWAVEEIAGLGDVDMGAWSPAVGDVSAGDDFCVATGERGNSGRSANYGVQVAPLAGSTFDLTSTTTPGLLIPATIDFEDLQDGTVETLVPSVLTRRNKTGVLDCTGASNARLTVNLAAADLAAVPPGEYAAPLRLTGRRANLQQSVDFTARIRVLELIRISGLDPIVLGAFDGINDVLGGDDFCIYSNAVGGSYSITAQGQGAGGALVLASDADTLPYTLEYDDGSGFVPVPANVAVSRSNAFATAVDCGGGSNAGIRVTTLAADLRSASAGAYAGELMLLVSPL